MTRKKKDEITGEEYVGPDGVGPDGEDVVTTEEFGAPPVQSDGDAAFVPPTVTAVGDVEAPLRVGDESLPPAPAPVIETPSAETHIFLDRGGSGTYAPYPKPPGWDHDRRILLNGRNFEHVADTDDGGWCYRAM